MGKEKGNFFHPVASFATFKQATDGDLLRPPSSPLETILGLLPGAGISFYHTLKRKSLFLLMLENVKMLYSTDINGIFEVHHPVF